MSQKNLFKKINVKDNGREINNNNNSNINY